jgi:hypothetical protein
MNPESCSDVPQTVDYNTENLESEAVHSTSKINPNLWKSPKFESSKSEILSLVVIQSSWDTLFN